VSSVYHPTSSEGNGGRVVSTTTLHSYSYCL